MQGWVKLHRQVLTNEVFRHDHSAWHVFEVLLLLADKDRKSWSGGLNQLTDFCEMNRNTVYKCVIRLEKKNMVNRTVNGRFTIYNIVNYDHYQDNGKQNSKHPVNAGETPGKHPVKLIQEKEIELEDIDKSISAPRYGNPEINDMFDFWENELGYKIESRLQPNRNACSNLLKKHGKGKVEQLIKGVVIAQQDKYAPRIADFADLQSKLNQLVLWGKNRAATPGVEVIS